MIDVHEKTKFKKRFSNNLPFNFIHNSNERGSNRKQQRVRNVDPPKEWLTCGKCGKKHVGECLVGTNCFYGCGKVAIWLKSILMLEYKARGMENINQMVIVLMIQKGCFYALKARGDIESSPDLVTGMLNIFFDNVYALLYLCCIFGR